MQAGKANCQSFDLGKVVKEPFLKCSYAWDINDRERLLTDIKQLSLIIRNGIKFHESNHMAIYTIQHILRIAESEEWSII